MSSPGRMYEIYDQKATPALDMRFHMHAWLRFLEDKLLKRPLTDNEFIFPTIGSNGIVYTTQFIDHNIFQDRLNKYAKASGILVVFTTHSFRRGGAQYRFQECSLSKRWSLAQILWWGGWAEGEKVTASSYMILEVVSTH